MSVLTPELNVAQTASRISPSSPCDFQFAWFKLLGSNSGTPVPHSPSQQDSTMVFVPVLFNNSDSHEFCSNFARMPGKHLAFAFCFHFS